MELIVLAVTCLCCVFVFVLIGAGIFFFIQQQQKNKDVAPASAPAATPFTPGMPPPASPFGSASTTPPPPASPFGTPSAVTPPPASPFDRPAVPRPPVHEQTMIMMEPDEPTAPRGDARGALDALNAPGKPYTVAQENAFSYAIGLNPPGDYRLNISLDEANGVARLMEVGSSELSATIRADVVQALQVINWRVQ